MAYLTTPEYPKKNFKTRVKKTEKEVISHLSVGKEEKVYIFVFYSMRHKKLLILTQTKLFCPETPSQS